MADIKSIKTRLDALLKKARDAGSTEAEVAACMVKAQTLMEKYGVTEADLDNSTTDSFKKYGFGIAAGKTNFDVIDRKLGNIMADFCGVRVYHSRVETADGSPQIVYFGMEADVEFLLWMRASLRTFMDDQWDAFKSWTLTRYSRDELAKHKIGFIQGFCSGIHDRLHAQMHSYRKATGTALVVKKNEVVTKAMADAGIRLGAAVRMRGGAEGSRYGYGAGNQAAQAADLGRGVAAPRIAIGR